MSMSTMSYIEGCFYTFTTTAMTIIICFYSLSNQSTTTIIPCIQSLWYKLYTSFLFLFVISYIDIASLETRKVPCERFVTFDLEKFNVYPSCRGTGRMDLKSAYQYYWDEKEGQVETSFSSTRKMTPINQQLFRGIYLGTSNGSGTRVDLLPWDGWCQGVVGDVKGRLELPRRHLDNATDWLEDLRE